MRTDRRSDEIELAEIDKLLETVDNGDPTALTQAVDVYQGEITSNTNYIYRYKTALNSSFNQFNYDSVTSWRILFKSD